MTLHVTYCSSKKDETDGRIPALKRYRSNRIRKIYSHSQERNEDFAILSGKFGLLQPKEKIPYYDRLLKQEDVPHKTPDVRKFLRRENIDKVIYHTKEIRGERKPYFRLIRNACEEEEVDFEVNILEG